MGSGNKRLYKWVRSDDKDGRRTHIWGKTLKEKDHKLSLVF